MTEGLYPLCLERNAFLSDSSISSLVHSDVIVSLNSDDSVSHLFCWFSSCQKMSRLEPQLLILWDEKNWFCLTSHLRSFNASIFREESLNVVSASSLARSFPTFVEGTASNSVHKVWIDCLNSLNVFSLFICNIECPITNWVHVWQLMSHSWQSANLDKRHHKCKNIKTFTLLLFLIPHSYFAFKLLIPLSYGHTNVLNEYALRIWRSTNEDKEDFLCTWQWID